MRALFALIIMPVIIIGILRSDLTPWRIVSQAELADLNQRIIAARAAAAATIPPGRRPGAWMFDPSYRTSLERSTVVGVPEASKRREYSH